MKQEVMPIAELRAREARAMTEAAFTARVIVLAHELGWKVVHFRPARTAKGWRTPCEGDAEGWVDLILISVKQKRTLFVELKSEKGHITPAQEEWLETLRQAGEVPQVWRPSDFQYICEFLKGE